MATRIDRTIHSSSLFGRHVGECSGEDFRRFGRLPLAWQPGCDTEAQQPHVAGGSVYESVGGLDVLVDETVLVYPAERSRQSDGETKELSQLHRRSDQAVEWLASGILQHEHGAALVLCERDKANCPGGVPVLSARNIR